MELSPAPPGLHAEYAELFSTDCLYFLGDLISTFDEDVDQVRDAARFSTWTEKSPLTFPTSGPSDPAAQSIQKGSAGSVWGPPKLPGEHCAH